MSGKVIINCKLQDLRRFLRENLSFRCIVRSYCSCSLQFQVKSQKLFRAVIGLIILKEVLETSKSPWWSLAVPDGEDLLRCESAHARNMIDQMMGLLVCALYDCVYIQADNNADMQVRQCDNAMNHMINTTQADCHTFMGQGTMDISVNICLVLSLPFLFLFLTSVVLMEGVEKGPCLMRDPDKVHSANFNHKYPELVSKLYRKPNVHVTS